jgi:hypothetical protein
MLYGWTCALMSVSAMTKYRKKPVVIDAMQLPPADEDATEELKEFLHAMTETWESERGGYLTIHTLEGDMAAKPGDWIIKGVKGEYYPCKADVFALTYDSCAWEATMTDERYREVNNDQEAKLTEQELADGWHFCPEWDGLLVNSYDEEGEGAACICT